MSVSSIGGGGVGNLNQLMAALLSRIKASEAAATATPSTSTTPSTATTDTNTDVSTDTSNAATGTTAPTLSDQVIGMLVVMQMSGADPASTSSTSGSGASSASGSSASDPVAQAFASLDTDGNGSISQSEMETAIENVGGTADEADTVYSALGGTSSAGISEGSFAQAAQAGAPPPGGPQGMGGHHHHHHHGGGMSASDEASQIFSTLQTNPDGSVSDDTLAAALGGSTSNDSTAAAGATNSSDGTTASGSSADSLVASIDANGDGSVTQTELANYLQTLQQQIQSGQSTSSAFAQMANQSYTNNLGLFAPASNQLAAA